MNSKILMFVFTFLCGMILVLLIDSIADNSFWFIILDITLLVIDCFTVWLVFDSVDCIPEEL